MVQYKNKLNWHCSKKSCSVNSASIDRSACNLVLTTPLENNLVHVNIGKQTIMLSPSRLRSIYILC